MPGTTDIHAVFIAAIELNSKGYRYFFNEYLNRPERI